MSRQTVILLVMVLAIAARADTISKQPTTVSPSSVTANVPSTLIAEPQIPSNNKPQPVKGPTVDSIPAVQPVIINNTVESKSPEQISKKEESSTPVNATTTIAEEMPISSPATVLSTNQTGSQKQAAQPITVIDAKGSKGETTVQVIEKNEKQTSSQDKLQRQAAEEKKARQSLLKSNNTEMVKAQPAATPSVIEKHKQIETVTANISENSNNTQNVQDQKDSLQNKDKKTLENSIVISKEPQYKATEKQNAPQQVIVVDIAKVETTNQTTPQEEVDSEDQLLAQNETQAHQQTTARPQIVKQRSQQSNEIKIIPLDNQSDEQTQEEEEEEEDEVEQEIKPVKEQTFQNDKEKQLKPIIQASVAKKEAPSKDNKTVNAKKDAAETQKPITPSQKPAPKGQIKKETATQSKKEENTKQQDTKQNTNQQKNISVKKQSHEQKQIPKEKQQTSKPKEVTSQSVTKIKEKIAEHYENQVKQTKQNTVSRPKSAKGPQKSATQSPKNDITKSSDAQNIPQEHTSNLRRQQQHLQSAIEKDIDEIEAERPKKTEQTKQKTSVQKEQPNNANHQESLKQLLEEVKSDLSNDAKTKIIQHLENQIKQQEASKITILEEKPEIQKNEYLQLQSSSPRQGSKSPEKEEEVSSEEIMDTKTVIVIIILTFIISIPIVREIKSKDSQTKESKNKMENDLKESSQTLGLEFSELDNETGYGEPLDQQQR